MRGLATTVRAVVACAIWAITPARAQQTPTGCSSEPAANGAQTLRCGGGVTIVAESGAQYSVVDRDRNGTIDTVELRGGAVLVDVTKQRAGRRFEVITPQAIAAVRGTKWAVDTDAAKTSVFVVRGQVGVRRPAETGGVTLGPGEGVDVESANPLVVKRWPQPRVAALLARLGQQ
jgi:ferric-dicitrate binding protein FerR (iron transport regulator)